MNQSAGQATPRVESALGGGGIASLLPLPPGLQNTVIAAVMSETPERGTDIWYKDKSSGAVFVMRHGMQWQLNETASLIWERMGQPVENIVKEISQMYTGSDPQDVRFQVVEFLLNANSHGLIELYPERTASTPKQ